MKIEFLGVGEGLNFTLGNTAALVNEKVIVDCGLTVPSVLTAKKKWERITDILITHAHADHIGGLESLAFVNRFILGRKPRLHLASQEFARDLWERSLRGGMERLFLNDRPVKLKLEDYFEVLIGKTIKIMGLPEVRYRLTEHTPDKECYSISFADKVYYSGDTSQLPPGNYQLIFQDCTFKTFPYLGPHTSLERLNRELPPEVKAKIWLMHYGSWYKKVDVKKMGFKGLVKPGQVFKI